MAWKQLMGSEVLNVSLSGGAAEAEGEGEETGAVLHIYAHCEGMPHYRSRAAAAAAGGAGAGAQTTRGVTLLFINISPSTTFELQLPPTGDGGGMPIYYFLTRTGMT
jgi:hypothetical protein